MKEAIAAVLVCLPLSMLLTGLETALLAVSRVRVRHYAKEGDTRARQLAELFQNREHLLTGILILNNALTLVVFAFITRWLVDHFGPAGYAITFAVSLPVYLLCGELIPKSIFKHFPFRVLRRFVGVLRFIALPILPLVRLSSMIGRVFGGGTQRGSVGESEGGGPSTDEADKIEAREEFKSLARFIEREGMLGPVEREMIHNVVDFEKTRARDVMVPMSRVTALPVDMPIASVIPLARQTGLDQFPVMSKSGDLVGLLNMFEILRDPLAAERTVFHYLRKLVRVQPDDSAAAILHRLRRTGIHLAGVFSPEGRPLGLVSVEDMVQHMISRTPTPAEHRGFPGVRTGGRKNPR